MSRENNRSKMPLVTAFIDDLRSAFGVEEIDNVIRRGLHSECELEHRFFAAEAGHEMGRRYMPVGVIVPVSAMVLAIVDEAANEPVAAVRKRGRSR